MLAGWLGTPKLWNLGERFRGFETLAGAGVRIGGARRRRRAGTASTEWMLMGLSVAVAIIGICDRALFLPSQAGDPGLASRRSAKPLYTLLYNKWYVDEIYDFLFVNGLCKGGGRRWARSTATWWMAA